MVEPRPEANVMVLGGFLVAAGAGADTWVLRRNASHAGCMRTVSSATTAMRVTNARTHTKIRSRTGAGSRRRERPCGRGSAYRDRGAPLVAGPGRYAGSSAVMTAGLARSAGIESGADERVRG